MRIIIFLILFSIYSNIFSQVTFKDAYKIKDIPTADISKYMFAEENSPNGNKVYLRNKKQYLVGKKDRRINSYKFLLHNDRDENYKGYLIFNNHNIDNIEITNDITGIKYNHHETMLLKERIIKDTKCIYPINIPKSSTNQYSLKIDHEIPVFRTNILLVNEKNLLPIIKSENTFFTFIFTILFITIVISLILLSFSPGNSLQISFFL